jgi:hypothetical protein
LKVTSTAFASLNGLSVIRTFSDDIALGLEGDFPHPAIATPATSIVIIGPRIAASLRSRTHGGPRRRSQKPGIRMQNSGALPVAADG